jgi:hypothetical protein
LHSVLVLDETHQDTAKSESSARYPPAVRACLSTVSPGRQICKRNGVDAGAALPYPDSVNECSWGILAQQNGHGKALFE